MSNEELIALLGKVVEEALITHRTLREREMQLALMHEENEGLLKENEELRAGIEPLKNCDNCRDKDRDWTEQPCDSCYEKNMWTPAQNKEYWASLDGGPQAELSSVNDCADGKVEVIE